MKRKINTPWNYDYTTIKYKLSKKPSATVPDQNYTMRQILDKFTRGQPINDMGTYNDYDYDNPDPKQFQDHLDEYLPHPKTLDLVERAELKENIQKEQKKQKSHKNTQNDTKKKEYDNSTPEKPQ